MLYHYRVIFGHRASSIHNVKAATAVDALNAALDQLPDSKRDSAADTACVSCGSPVWEDV